MKKTLVIVSVVAVILLSLLFWQKNNIEALYMYLTKDSVEVSEFIEKTNKELSEEISKYSDDIPRNFTKEEEEKIASGEISIEEAANILLSEEKDPLISENSGNEIKEEPGKTENPAPTDNKAKVSSIIKRYTAQFYSMKAYYMGQLSQIEGKARAEYSALSKEEKKNLSKATFVGQYAGYALSLQSECDKKVESLLSDMKKELKEAGGDTSIISVIKEAYETEKAAKKAYYLNLVG